MAASAQLSSAVLGIIRTPMMDWDKLRIFHAVASAQSFTRAGEMLNVSQSAISRQVAALEEHLQVALFHRHARGLLLTEQGEILLRSVNDILTRLTAAENALLETRERPRGPLKVTAPVAFGTVWLTPCIREFMDNYPEINVTLMVDDRELDLSKREADVAIRMFPARHPELVQKKLTTLSVSAYASTLYVANHGIPKKPEDLAHHRLITYPEDARLPYPEVNWLLNTCTPDEEQSSFKINSLLGMQRAVEHGLGIAGLPDYMIQNRSNITKVLPHLKGPEVDMYLIYPLELKQSKRINVFRDYLVRRLTQDGLIKGGKQSYDEDACLPYDI